jgi:hypothetical protein
MTMGIGKEEISDSIAMLKEKLFGYVEEYEAVMKARGKELSYSPL